MTKYNINTRDTFYQKARFFRKAGTDEAAYCIEPFSFFQENQYYESTDTPYNLSQDKIEKIKKIAYYGYGYQNHTEPKWYAITQMMIWQVSDEAGNYYFTETLNGSPVNMFIGEMGEINNLVNNSSILPSFSNKQYEIVEGKSITIEDQNQVLTNYSTNHNQLEINQNKVTIHSLTEGEYEFKFTKNMDNRSTPLLFYQSYNSQNMVKAGNIQGNEATIKIKVIKTELIINKIDKDTQSTSPTGNASLDGAIYELLDENKEIITSLTIENNQAIINNLNFGKYYLKEIQAGEGYTLDEELHEFEITKENPTCSLILENAVIKSTITIEKNYGTEDNWEKEKGIAFWIQDQENNRIETITTNEKGEISINLPYGEYTLIQINSTEGYEKIDPVSIHVLTEEPIYLVLKDIKIAVPDTHTEKVTNIYKLLLQFLWIFLL